MYYLWDNGVRRFRSVYVLYKFPYTALVVQSFGLYILRVARVGEYYLQTRVEESLFAQTAKQSFVIIHRSFGKYFGVCLEFYYRAGALGSADDL